MYLFTLSTPERATAYVSQRTLRNLIARYGRHREGYSVFHSGVHGLRYVGCIVRGQLVMP